MSIQYEKNLQEVLEKKFNFTPSERRICEFLIRGNTRSDLKRLTGFAENELKGHLNQICAKTLVNESNDSDNFHKLTLLLWRTMRENENNQTS